MIFFNNSNHQSFISDNLIKLVVVSLKTAFANNTHLFSEILIIMLIFENI